jgi:hypothetical protein
VLEMAGAFGAIRSTISVAPGAIGVVEMFALFAGQSGMLAVAGLLSVLRGLGILAGRAI